MGCLWKGVSIVCLMNLFQVFCEFWDAEPLYSLFICRCVPNFSFASLSWVKNGLPAFRTKSDTFSLFCLFVIYLLLWDLLWFSFFLSLFIYIFAVLFVRTFCMQRHPSFCLCSEGVRNAFRRGLSSCLVTWFHIGLDTIVFHANAFADVFSLESFMGVYFMELSSHSVCYSSVSRHFVH